MPKAWEGEGYERTDLMRSFRGAQLGTTTRARELRRDATDVEKRLWQRLRGRQIENLKFVRQQAIGPYYGDFACREARVVIELDGGQHADSEYDARRDAFMISQSYIVLRFWNTEVMENIEGVIGRIVEAVRNRD
ncbi:endonuclease domain-containing protein [Vineibacter terrae]|uniref:endonuclease domain-containing protein n=1 Tax=Vineibacter terrae TaxID=2586908 RepID=UPI002E315A75|nr:DUF559 domain-containing protein [Vineibacter terrae]HEX2889389.1 DUF559 domain-containing protein [Vineibacter terrae]